MYYIFKKEKNMEFKITITEEDIKKYPNNYELGAYIRKTYNQQEPSNFELCLTCGKKTPYRLDTPIEERVGYIENEGQGCYLEKKCKNSLVV
jgi:hypothetical protein